MRISRWAGMALASASLIAAAPAHATVINGQAVDDNALLTFQVSTNGTLIRFRARAETFDITDALVDGLDLGAFTAVLSGQLGNFSDWSFYVSYPAGPIAIAITLANGQVQTDSYTLPGPNGNFTVFHDDVPDAPEPATLALLGAGLAGLGLIRRRK